MPVGSGQPFKADGSIYVEMDRTAGGIDDGHWSADHETAIDRQGEAVQHCGGIG